MAAWFYKKAGGLFPADDDVREKVARLGDGELLLLTIERPRCPILFRKYWAMCTRIGENQDPPRDKDSIDAEIRIRAGHFDVVPINGFDVPVPKRIAFTKLTQEQWEEFFQKAEMAICQHFGPEYLEKAA